MGINIRETLGDEADSLLNHECKTIERDQLSLPGPDFVDRVLVQSDRPVAVLRNLQQMFDHGRLGGTGYLSILPVDQGIEHSGAASFSKNPAYFDPERLAELALAADCSAFASTLGGLGIIARRYAQEFHSGESSTTTSSSPTRTAATKCLSQRSAKPSIWARSASERRSTSAPRRARARSEK